MSSQTTAGPQRHVLRILRSHARAFYIIIPLALLEVALDGGLTLSYKYLIDNAIVPNNARALITILSLLAAGVLVASIGAIARDYLYARKVTEALNDVRRTTFDHCQRLSTGFHSTRPSGDILARFSTDLAGLEASLAGAVNALLLPLLGVILGVILLFFILDWRVALIGTLIWPLVLVGPRILAPRASNATYEKKQHEATLLSTVQETFAGHRVVKAYGLQALGARRLETDIARLTGSAVRAGFLSSLVERATVITIYTIQVTALAVGAFMAYRGLVTVGTLVAFLTIFWNLGWSLVVIGRSAPALVSAIGSTRRIDELLDEQPDVSDVGNAADIPPLREEIDFDGVSFGYNPAELNLRDVSFRIRRGEYVAFVGPSGSGKSTVLNLITRFYDPRAGRVLIDGVDLKKMTSHSLRAQMGLVQQESFLFDTTVRENIRLGRLDATDAEVEAAARAAELHDVIATMPAGYDTMVGERGGLLSGGQRQRVALARALLRDPPILLLDEASSALDPTTEAAVNETLRTAGRGRTTLSVTHRLAVATHADRIIVVEAGRVVEQGSHDELVARDGLYAELWRKQSGFIVSDDGARADVTPARLREIALLAPLDDQQLSALAALFVCERATAGQTIVREGDAGSLFYLIARGRVAVSRTGADGAAQEIAILEDGDQFGEMALLYDAPRGATVTAKTDCLLLTLTRSHFLALLQSSPQVRANVERIAAERAASDNV